MLDDLVQYDDFVLNRFARELSGNGYAANF
jgi:hypothetical protein